MNAQIEMVAEKALALLRGFIRSPLQISVALLIVAVIAANIYVSHRPGLHPDKPASPAPPPVAAPSDMAASSVSGGPQGPLTDGDLKAAFAVAFGQAAPAPKSVYLDGAPMTLTYTPVKILRLGDQVALLSQGLQAPGCASCIGAVSVHYLKQTPAGFEVTGAWPAVAAGAAAGAPLTLKLRQDLFQSSALQIEGISAKGDCKDHWGALVELADGGPVVRTPSIPMGFEAQAIAASDEPRPAPDDPGRLTGRIRPDVKGQSFLAVYSGATSAKVRYKLNGAVYQAEAGGALPSCGAG